jgi:hypothetical protein
MNVSLLFDTLVSLFNHAHVVNEIPCSEASLRPTAVKM